jgi:hypothetical protein
MRSPNEAKFLFWSTIGYPSMSYVMGATWAKATRLGGYGLKGCGGLLATRLHGYGYMAISFMAIGNWLLASDYGYWLYGH